MDVDVERRTLELLYVAAPRFTEAPDEERETRLLLGVYDARDDEPFIADVLRLVFVPYAEDVRDDEPEGVTPATAPPVAGRRVLVPYAEFLF